MTRNDQSNVDAVPRPLAMVAFGALLGAVPGIAVAILHFRMAGRVADLATLPALGSVLGIAVSVTVFGVSSLFRKITSGPVFFDTLLGDGISSCYFDCDGLHCD